MGCGIANIDSARALTRRERCRVNEFAGLSVGRYRPRAPGTHNPQAREGLGQGRALFHGDLWLSLASFTGVCS